MSASPLFVLDHAVDVTRRLGGAGIEAMVEEAVDSFDLREAVRWVAAVVGDDDPRVARLRGLGSLGAVLDPEAKA